MKRLALILLLAAGSANAYAGARPMPREEWTCDFMVGRADSLANEIFAEKGLDPIDGMSLFNDDQNEVFEDAYMSGDARAWLADQLWMAALEQGCVIVE